MANGASRMKSSVTTNRDAEKPRAGRGDKPDTWVIGILLLKACHRPSEQRPCCGVDGTRMALATSNGATHAACVEPAHAYDLPPSTGWPSARQRSIPPARFATALKPARCSSTEACAERAPDRQTATTERDPASPAALPA